MIFRFLRRRERDAHAASASSQNSESLVKTSSATKSETPLSFRLGGWIVRAGIAVCFWAAASVFNFSLDAFNNSLSRARFNREMEKVKKSIEMTVNR